MKNYLFIFTLLLSTLSFAQGSNGFSSNLSSATMDNSQQNMFNAVNYQGAYLANGKSSAVVGSPFAFEDATIEITSKEGKVYKVPNGNYNAKSNQIVSNFAKDSSFVFDAKAIESVKFDKYVAKIYRDEDSRAKFFFELTPHATVKLLKRYEAIIKDGQINVMTKQKTSPDKYVVNDSYAVSKDGVTTEEFKLKKKSILKLLGDKKKLVEKFVDDNDLSYKEEADVVKIFNYYSIN
ncbi:MULTISPECIES: hypothetical protein [unclassified Olleya]|jgi:prolyl oligopeptidase PreP (S9A serine peptidase family)|uniref:hypothetical protein n=1 Tax=unclassified Olleya TaxID=2615019 RepID=UPI0011A8D322|nr:hypothetical protein [Olleya sp. Hel_I_94]TVZ50037.1 hypothetical protein JM82_0483 [Olleya sp. Hel_I_94]|tara:strand:- start:43119 stop:43826 length:708 start_codon:yes stop_codon:yes gene_type:complete